MLAPPRLPASCATRSESRRRLGINGCTCFKAPRPTYSQSVFPSYTSHLNELHTSPMNTAPSPNTAAPPTICEVDIPPPAEEEDLCFRLLGRAADLADLVDADGVEGSREVEESTNPICFNLIVSELLSPRAIPGQLTLERRTRQWPF